MFGSKSGKSGHDSACTSISVGPATFLGLSGHTQSVATFLPKEPHLGSDFCYVGD